MPCAFDNQLAAASEMLDRQYSEAVTVTRGSNSTAGVLAAWTSQGDVLVSPVDAQTQVVDRVWLIRKTLYLISASAVEPRTGDRITDAAGAVWEVLPSLAGPAVLSFENGRSWEVRTKKVT